MAFAVIAVLPVRLVVLVVVRDKITQREAVVGDYEGERGSRTSIGMFIEVAGSGDPRGKLGKRRRLSTPEVAYGVAVLPVPFAPQRWKVADLIATIAQVPWLGDQFDLGDHGVLLDDIEEGRQLVHFMKLPSQCRCKIKSEPVDMHLQDPITQ